MNSQCLICGHIYFDSIREYCERCRGLCAHYTDHELMSLGRRIVTHYDGQVPECELATSMEHRQSAGFMGAKRAMAE